MGIRGEYLGVRRRNRQKSGENHVMENFIFVLVTYYWNVTWRRLAWAWHLACVGEMRVAYYVCFKYHRHPLHHRHICGRIISKWMFMKVHWWNMGCIHSPEDRGRWLVSVNEVTNVQVPQKVISWAAERLLAFEDDCLIRLAEFVEVEKFNYYCNAVYLRVLYGTISNTGTWKCQLYILRLS